MKRKTLVDKVTRLLDERELDGRHRSSYVRVADKIEQFKSKVDGHILELKDGLKGARINKYGSPDELYMGLIRHIAEKEQINLEGIETPDDLRDLDDDAALRLANHLTIQYGLGNEVELRKRIGELSEGKYTSDDQIDTVLTDLAELKSQQELQTAVSQLTSHKTFAAKSGKGGTHHTFMQAISDHTNPEIDPVEVDTYKSSQEAQQYLVGAARQGYQRKQQTAGRKQ